LAYQSQPTRDGMAVMGNGVKCAFFLPEQET